jgi:hypothetical protein
MLFKNSVRTSKRTPHFTITKINWLTLFKFKALQLHVEASAGVGNLFMLEGRINLAVIKKGRNQETSIRYT